jgi:MFS family permease
MFIAPALGLLFDKYSKKKKFILISSSILFLASFLFSVLNGSNVGIFGFFLALNLLAQEFIKVIVSKMIIEHSNNENVKDGHLTAINVSSNVGSFIPSIVFLFTVHNIFSINQWNIFFLFGFLSSLPIILSIFLMKSPAKDLGKNLKHYEKDSIGSGGINLLNFILLFLSYLLIWSDKLYQFPFSSWILTKFGEEGFNIYSLFYIVLILLNIGGWIIGQRISSGMNKKIEYNITKNRIEIDTNENHQEAILNKLKLYTKKRIIAVTVGVYIALTFMMAFSDFIFLMMIQGIIQVVAGIMMLNYTSLMMAISNTGKYKTFKFQCLKIAYAFSCVIFIPLGTYFSAFIEIEILIITVGFLAIISLIPLAFLRTKTY